MLTSSRVVITYPISVGKMDWRTPLGETRVIAKIRHPAWYPPESIRKEHAANDDPLPKVVPAGPDNPLGDFALRLAAGNGEYMIHGTNNPTAVGMSVTHGCIRMYPEDVAALFPLVSGGHQGVAGQRAGEGRVGGRQAAARGAPAGRRRRTERRAGSRSALEAARSGAR